MDRSIYNMAYFKHISSRADWNPNGVYIAKAINRLFNPKSAVDFGCGTGRILKSLYTDFDCKDIFGMEGCEDAFDFIDLRIIEYIKLQDITTKIRLGRKYDVVICTEVAEHIPTEFSDVLVDNICRAGDVLIFSAAPVGQSKLKSAGHINEQPFDFWEKLFAKHDFYIDDNMTQQYKDSLTKDKAKIIYINNGAIFKRSGTV